MRQEAPLIDSRELSNLLLKRSVFLSAGHDRLKVDPDGSVAFLHSTRFGKLLFGRGVVEPFKIQAGVIISQRQREMRIRLAPSSIGLSTWNPEPLQASQSIRLCSDGATGYTRVARYTNRSEANIRLRVLTLHDPTSLNFRIDRDPPAEIGVNAFNRGDHVVMDDVGDTTGVRIIGFSPRPAVVYLTRSKQKALELLAAGELPENTAGMSGAILVLSQHDADLQPGSSFGVEVTSLYHDSSLEMALSEFKDGASGGRGHQGTRQESVFRCSSPSVNFAFSWAKSTLDCVESEGYSLDRIASGFGVGVLRPGFFEEEFAAAKRSQRRDGFLPHSSSDRGGPMETALFVISACRYLGLTGDRKLGRKWYPVLRKAGNALRGAAQGGLIVTPAGSPDGWRRRLPSGYPTGFVTEVNMVAASALSELSSLSRSFGKPGESSAFRNASAEIAKCTDERLRDLETGSLALNLDPKGRLHMESTVDQAVALSYSVPDRNLGSSAVHRLLERDYETGYGPRSVSKTNALYYSSDYGEGQLGGYWTRSSLAHAILAFASGHPAIGSAQVEKVSALVHSECERMGGVPGEFPYWFDPERKRIESTGSDPVAASRFVEALLTGEVGMKVSQEVLRFLVPSGSRLRWMALRGFKFGGGSLFVGRSESKTLVVSSLAKGEVEGSMRLQWSESLEVPSALECVLFWDKSSVLVCVGNESDSPISETLQVPVGGKPLAASLFADFEEFNAETWRWEKPERRRVPVKVDLRVEVGPNSWKAYRISSIPFRSQITS
ncbi:MAG: hypothetical protein ABSG45_04075 [Nitrososphaerales archaeon]